MAAPPANTLIGNQATASYVDGNGITQLATSNLVQTQVQQVGSFTLDTFSIPTTTVFNTKTGAGGTTVYAPHTLTNTGNGTDSFNVVISNGPNGVTGVMPVAVFPDANGDGLPDAGAPVLCSVPAGGTCTVPAQTVAGNGGTFKFVVAYSIPAGATPATPYSSGLVTATPVTTALYTAPNTSAADVDDINVTIAAAFNASKSLSVPTVSGPGGSTYPVALQSGPRSVAGCTATYAAASAPAAGCVYSTYTIQFQNTGGAPGAFYMNDVLPAGFTYVTGSAVWSGAAGTALGEGAGADPVGIDFAVSGNNVSARIANVNPSVASSISFMVLVNNTAVVGVSTTTNTATYDPITTAHLTAVGTAGSTSTNPAAFIVIASYGVTLGSSIGALPASTDTVAGTPNGTFGTAGTDQNVVASIVSGGSVKFTQTVFNTGKASDTFNISSTANTFPAGTVFTFFRADGLTPLLDTNGDSIVDTGIVAGGASTTIVVQATIPTVTPPAGPYTVTVRATSASDATKFDASGDQVTAVTGILVDLTNSAAGTGVGSVGTGDLGAGPSPLPTMTNSTPAGTGTIFTLFIKNNDSIAQTYIPAASQLNSFPGSLPAGWTVKFVAAGATCASATVITTTASVAAGAQLQIDACVTPPVTATAGTTNIYFRASSATNASTGVIVNDTKTDAVTVTAAATYSVTLTPNNNGQVAPAGTVVYAHTLNNTGAQSCGGYTLSGVQSGSGAGWSFAIFTDVNGNGIIDAGDTPVTGAIAGPFAPGAATKYLVRVFAPGGAVAGQQDTVTLTATFLALSGGTCGPVSATDITTVVTGQIRAVKQQAIDATCDGIADTAFGAALITGAKPGQCVIYKVVATNEGTANVTQLSINDALPSFTSLTGATQPASTTQCVPASGTTGGVAAGGQAFVGTTTVSCGAATTVPPGGTLTLSFAVRINP